MRTSPERARQVWKLVASSLEVDPEHQQYFCFMINCKKSHKLTLLDGDIITWVNVWHNKPPHFDYKGRNSARAEVVDALNAVVEELFLQS